MTDEQLANFLGIEGYPNTEVYIRSLSPNHRATYERMHSITVEMDLWQAGLGPKPTGVLIDKDRKRRKRA